MPWAESVIAKAEPVEKAVPLSDFEREIQKADRSIIPEYIWEPSYRIREPIYNFEELMLIGRTSWILKNVFFALIRETLSPGWRLDPGFAAKCSKCNREFKEMPPEGKCPCGAEEKLTGPNPDQKRTALNLLIKPNPDFTFHEVIKSTVVYDLGLDNYFLSVSFKYIADPTGNGEIIKVPAELNVEDPRYMRVVADEKGHRGDPKQLFCPDCWKPDLVYAPPQVTCPTCGKPLEKTAYVQRVGGAIKARYADYEIIHASSDRYAPNLYGESRIVCLWKLLVSMQAMDDFNLELYTEGKLGSIVNFPGHEQEEVNEIMDQFEQETLRKRVYDPILRRFRTTKKIRTIMLASKEPVRVTRIMEDFQRMQSLEFYKFWKAGVASVYDAMPVFTGDIEAGKAGTVPMMQVTVQDRAIREKHLAREDIMNNKVFPIFGITDWKFKFNRLELRDDVRLAEIGQIKANTAFTWRKAGFRVRVNEHGDLEVWGEPEEEPPKPQKEEYRPPQPEKISIESEATGELRERTGRFAPKPAGDQAEAYKQDSPVTSETPAVFSPVYTRKPQRKIERWVNPLTRKEAEEEDLSRRA